MKPSHLGATGNSNSFFLSSFFRLSVLWIQNPIYDDLETTIIIYVRIVELAEVGILDFSKNFNSANYEVPLQNLDTLVISEEVL